MSRDEAMACIDEAFFWCASNAFIDTGIDPTSMPFDNSEEASLIRYEWVENWVYDTGFEGTVEEYADMWGADFFAVAAAEISNTRGAW